MVILVEAPKADENLLKFNSCFISLLQNFVWLDSPSARVFLRNIFILKVFFFLVEKKLKAPRGKIENYSPILKFFLSARVQVNRR